MTVATPSRNLVHMSTVLPYKPRVENFVSWSKNGFIAYISPALTTANTVFLSHLENIDGWAWQLAPKEMVHVDKSVLLPLSMVCWSNLNTDLAVADVHGNFYILMAGVGLVEPQTHSSDMQSMKNGATGLKSHPQNAVSPSYELTSYDHMEVIFREIVSEKEGPSVSEACATSIVAFKWLNIEKAYVTNLPASRNRGLLEWSYSDSQVTPVGAAHPIGTKQACVVLRRNGELNMYYQGEHKVEYHKISTQISDDFMVISMASFGFSRGKEIYLTTFNTMSKKICTFVISIDWGFLVESSKKQKADPQYHTPLSAQERPSLSVVRLNEISPIPAIQLVQADGPESNEATDRVIACELSSIDIISATGAHDTTLDLFITYVTKCEGDDHFNSKIYRYNLVPESDLVLDAFTELGARKGIILNMPATTRDSLLMQGSIVRTGTVQSISTANSEPFLIVSYREGYIDVFSRITMELVSHEKDDSHPPPSTISSTCDVGFCFPKFGNDTAHTVMALSPTISSLVWFDAKDSSPDLTLQVFEKKWFKEITPSNLELTAAGIAYRHAFCCHSNTCSDDLFVLLEHEIQRIWQIVSQEDTSKALDLVRGFVDRFIVECHKALSFSLDAFSKELVDKLLSNPPLQKLLSLQMTVRDFGLSPVGDVTCDLAWVTLNMRSASFGIMFSLSSIYRQVSKKKPADDTMLDSVARGECIVSLLGNLKWLVDLMIYLNQELLELGWLQSGKKASKLSISNLVAIPLILSRVSRLFLMYALSAIGKTHDILKKLQKDLAEANKLYTPMRESLNRCFAICGNTPLNLGQFEAFLRECDALISKDGIIAAPAHDKSYSLNRERNLVCLGQISEADQALSQQIIAKHADTCKNAQGKELYFYDVEWLQIGANWHEKQPWINKAPLSILPKRHDFQKINGRLQYSHDTYVDCLRKIMISTSLNKRQKMNLGVAHRRAGRIRKCVRCRSLSLGSDPFVFEAPSAVGLWTMVFQRTCICGGAWSNYVGW